MATNSLYPPLYTPAKQTKFDLYSPVTKQTPQMSVVPQMSVLPKNQTTVTKTATPSKSSQTQQEASKSIKVTTSPEEAYQKDVRKQIENAYNEQLKFLTQQEQAAQEMLPTQLGIIQTQYESMIPELQQQLQTQQETGATQQEALRQQEAQAQAQIRRTGEEQSLRTLQRFGGIGGSSAAQAASELIGREQLKQLGQVQQQRVAGIENINTQLRAIQSEYNSNINKLNLEKERALQGVRDRFNQTIREIQAARQTAGTTKASQTLQALQDFATRRRSIEDQASNLQNALTLAREQAAINLQSLSLQQAVTPQRINLPTSGFTNTPAETAGRANLINTVAAQGVPAIEEAGWSVIGTEPNGTVIYRDSQGTLFDSKGNIRI